MMNSTGPAVESAPRPAIGAYLSLIKFPHTVFALPFALLGFFTAVWRDGYGLRWQTLVLVVVCMVLARTAAMAFNRWADRHIDARNDRTRSREIPAGIIPSRGALLLAAVSAVLFVVATYFINDLCFYLSPVALAVVLGYSYTKRFTALSHLVLGVGLSLAPTGAYLAVAGRFDLIPLLLSGAVMLWVSGFDIIYGLQDTDFDRAQRLKSLSAWLGNRVALFVSSCLHAFTFAMLVATGYFGHFGWLYWSGLGVFSVMLLYQHVIVKPNDLRRVNLAFFTANGVASVIFAVFAIADLWRSFNGAGISN